MDTGFTWTDYARVDEICEYVRNMEEWLKQQADEIDGLREDALKWRERDGG